MDDNNANAPKNQSGPVFESVPIDEVPQNIPTEEPPADVASAGDAFLNAPPPELTGELPPLYQESKTKYFIIGGAVLFFILIFAVVIGIFFSGGNKNQAPAEKVTITYWGLWEDPKVMQPIIDEYQKANPNVIIKYELQSHIDYRPKLIQRSQNGRGPDIFRYHNTWLVEIKDVAAPLPKEIMAAEEFDKTFYPIHKEDLAIEGTYYGIPLTVDGLLMIYNDSIFKKSGITTPPTSWIDDFYKNATDMTVQDRDGNTVTSGAALGTASNIDHFSDVLGTLLLQNGGDLTKLDQKEAVEALQFYRDFGEKNIWNDAMPNSIEAFAQEKVAIIFAPSWQIIRIKGINPDVQLKVAPVPKSPNNQSLALATYWVEGVSKFSKNQAESWKFLKYLSSKETQLKMYELQVKTRGIGTAFSRVDLQANLAQDPIQSVVVQQANTYKSLPLADRTFDKGINDEIVSYLRNAVNSTASGVSYQEALKTAKKGVDQVFTRYSQENPAAAAQ